MVGLTKTQLAKRMPARPAKQAAHGEDRELDQADVVAQQLGAELVLAHGHDDAAEGGEEEELAGEVGGGEGGDGDDEDLLGVERAHRVAGEVERRGGGDAVEAAQGGRADGPLVAGGAVGELEQDQGEGEGDDAEIDVADPAVEHEVAEEGSRKGGDGQGQGHRTGGVAEVDGGDGVGVAAEAEEGGLAEAQDAAEAPDQSLREGEDGEARRRRWR